MHTTPPARPNLRHALILSMFALVLLGGAICANASTARASALPPTFQHFRDLATGFYLDSDGSGDVYTLPWNNGNYQRWQPLPSDYGTVNLVDFATWRCLDSDQWGDVYTLPCNGGSFQKWIVLNRDYGSVVFRDLATGRVLDSDQWGDVYTLFENGGSYQKWIPAGW